MNQRLIWVDIVNICACAGVLLLHCTNYALWDYNGSITFDFLISVISHGFVLWPVDVFFMLTGFTLIKKTDNPLISLQKENLRIFYGRRLARLVIPILAWNLYYGTLLFRKLYNDGNLNIKEFIITFLSLETNGFFWFFIPLIGIYLVLPYYSVLCNSLNRVQLRNFILLASACICIPASINQYFDIPKFGNLFPIASGYLLFATIGYYLGNYEISHKSRKILYITGLLSCLFLTIELFYGKVYCGESNLSYLGVCCSLSAAAFFVWIRYSTTCNCLMGGVVTSVAFKKWSSLSLGVYLIQNTILSFFYRLSIFDNGFVRFVVLYPTCIVCVYVIKKIPYLRRIV